jgi:hypothetical protein
MTTKTERTPSMPTDGWITSFQSVVQEHATRTISEIDSPFSRKSHDTLIDLASYAGTLGRSDPHLEALARISGSLGNSDTWTPGSQQSSTLAGAGFGAEGITPNLLLGELIDKGVEDLIEHSSGDRQRVEAEVAAAKKEAQDAVQAERLRLEQERDQALGDLDAERAAKESALRRLTHAVNILEAHGRRHGPRGLRRLLQQPGRAGDDLRAQAAERQARERHRRVDQRPGHRRP